MTVSNQTNEFSHRWLLDSDVVFLNHGSFGATPKVVLDQQSRIRLQIEREPLLFFDHDYLPALDRARTVLAAFLGARTGDLAFIVNATTGEAGQAEEIAVLDITKPGSAPVASAAAP